MIQTDLYSGHDKHRDLKTIHLDMDVCIYHPYHNVKLPHSRQVWPGSGVKPALLADFWHDKWCVNQIWARCGNDGTVYVVACHIWPNHGLAYVSQICLLTGIHVFQV